MKRNKAEALIILIFLISFFHIYLSCTPSQQFLLKHHKVTGIDKEHVRVLLKKAIREFQYSQRPDLRLRILKPVQSFTMIKERIYIFRLIRSAILSELNHGKVLLSLTATVIEV
ncbi:MAG: hypothetical protein JXN64_13625 [Spirochaetes bacterium]|nr:hypothetical protein [Spirochaetota bacterium]